jgi:hypothetical protein
MLTTGLKKGYGGCWICRLWRKKCDENRPSCSPCRTFGIDCNYDSARPEWIDGGAKQLEMSEFIKAQVKIGAHLRREMSTGRLGAQEFIVNSTARFETAIDRVTGAALPRQGRTTALLL